jgi:hypothetical protein
MFPNPLNTCSNNLNTPEVLDVLVYITVSFVTFACAWYIYYIIIMLVACFFFHPRSITPD